MKLKHRLSVYGFLLLFCTPLLPCWAQTETTSPAPTPAWLRNEIAISFGRLGESFGDGGFYELRYTHYLKKWVGISGHFNFAREASDEFYSLYSSYQLTSLGSSLKLQLPLKHHSFGILAGPKLLHYNDLNTSASSIRYEYVEGAYVATETEYTIETDKGIDFGYILGLNYDFLPTPNIPLGIFMRIEGGSYYGSYFMYGLQAGYRF